MAISSIVEPLERQHALENKASAENTPKIHVDEIASKVAVFYERIRNVVDYREEHLFRKNFINRSLKRRLALQGNRDIAELLIKDVIRAGHLPNDKVPESKIDEVSFVINTFRAVREALRSEPMGERRALTDWFLRITSSSVEEILFPPTYERVLADFMTETIRRNLTVRNGAMDEARLSTGVFVAVERSLLRADDDQLRLHLFRFLYPELAAMGPEQGAELAHALPKVERTIESGLTDPKRAIFMSLAHRWAPAFSILGDVIRTADKQGELATVLNDKQALEERAHEAYRKRYRRERAKLRRFAALTVISFLISKIAIALAIEIPIQTYLLHSFSLENTVANILFPPLLMFVIVAFIRMPSRKNETLVVQEIERLVFEEKPREYTLALPKRGGAVAEFAVRIFYIGMFFVSLYIIYRVLSLINFSPLDITIFVLFISLVGAAGVKVHNRAREISLEPRKARVLGFILDIFAIPFITIGKWIISGLSTFNVVVVAVDMIVDLPFQVFVEFIENVRDFVRGRKEALD